MIQREVAQGKEGGSTRIWREGLQGYEERFYKDIEGVFFKNMEIGSTRNEGRFCIDMGKGSTRI